MRPSDPPHVARSGQPAPVPTDQDAGPNLAGRWVRVVRGPAVGTRGLVTSLAGSRLTMIASLINNRSLVLTVDQADCAPLPPSAEP